MNKFWPLFASNSSKNIALLRLSTRTNWKYLSSSSSRDTNEVSRGNTKQGRQNDGQKKSGFHLRLARKDDYQNVLELSKGIYDGEDYIPEVFHDWLSSPNKLMFLAELDGKAVGFDVVNILSGEKTVLRQALRVHPESRERGLFHKINSNVENYFRERYPQVSKQHYVVKCSNKKMIKIASKLGHEKTGKSTWHIFDVQKTSSLLPQLVISRYQMLLEQTAQHLYPYDTNIAAAMIDRGNMLHCFPPQKMMFRDWQPYEAIPANIEHLFKEDDQMFADISPQELLEECKFPSSFSHGCLSPRVRALFWTCTVYANDIESFRAHVLRQLEAATARITDQDFAFCVDVHSKIPSTSMDERRVLEEVLQRLHQNRCIKSEKVFLFEGVFDVDKSVR